MPVNNIKYSTVIDLVKNHIKSHCTNITNYSGIDACFKAGYVNSGTISSSGSGYKATYTYTITSSVPEVNSSTVDTEMTSYVTNNLHIDNISNNIPESEYYDFINDMVSFYCTKCVFTTSQFAPNTKYLIYYPSNTSFYNVKLIDTTGKKVAYATDVLELLNMLISGTNRGICNKTCIYSLTFT